MDFNQLLLWFVVCSCVVLLIRALLFRQKRGWFVVYSLILASSGIAWLFLPHLAGWFAFSLWLLFLWLPLVGFLKVNQMLDEQKYTSARQLATYLRWLHPADGWLEQPQVLRALELGRDGKIPEAFAHLNRYQGVSTKASRKATVLLYVMDARWEELLVWILVNIPLSSLYQNGDIALYYLRALGETGDVNALLEGIEESQKTWEQIGDVSAINLARIYAFAFCGQVGLVHQLFATTLAASSPQAAQFWLATALMAAGDELAGREELLALRRQIESNQDVVAGNHILHQAIAWRLVETTALPQRKLNTASKQILKNLQQQVQQESRYEVLGMRSSQKPYVTYALIFINIICFILEVIQLEPQVILPFALWGFTDVDSNLNLQINYMILNLGGLFPQAIFAGEWWRLINANFLHLGIIHLGMNMLGLYFLGPFVEFTLGRKKYLFTYLTSGIGSMFAFTILAVITGNLEEILVGASAAVIGLLGVIVAILLQGWLRERSRIAGRRLRIFFFIIAIQTLIDWLIPGISEESHIFGLIIGFLVGSILIFRNS